MSISDKLYTKCVLNFSKTIIDVTKEKDKYFLCQDNSLITVQYIIKLKNKPIQIMVKKCINVSVFSNKPIPSYIVGMYIVKSNALCDLYLIHAIDLKYKCFFFGQIFCQIERQLLYHYVTKYYKLFRIYIDIFICV
jgi:hypothetical protein